MTARQPSNAWHTEGAACGHPLDPIEPVLKNAVFPLLVVGLATLPALPGPGPHEIARQPGRDVFHIALGGLETHPAYGRTPLNPHDFRSQIVTLNFDTGELTELGHWARTEGISLRHLAMDHRGRLYVGGQIKSPERAVGDAVLWLVEGGRVTRLEPQAALGGYTCLRSPRMGRRRWYSPGKPAWR